jgi:hypothetical protein
MQPSSKKWTRHREDQHGHTRLVNDNVQSEASETGPSVPGGPVRSRLIQLKQKLIEKVWMAGRNKVTTNHDRTTTMTGTTMSPTNDARPRTSPRLTTATSWNLFSREEEPNQHRSDGLQTVLNVPGNVSLSRQATEPDLRKLMTTTKLTFPSNGGSQSITLQLSPVAYHIPWETILTGLRSRSEESRWKSARDLRGHLQMAARELQVTQMALVTQDLHRRLFTLVTSTETVDRLAGITAVHELVNAFVSAAIGVASATSSMQIATPRLLSTEQLMLQPSSSSPPMMMTMTTPSSITPGSDSPLMVPMLESGGGLVKSEAALSLGVTENVARGMARFANYVRLLLPANDLITTRLATETLGILARTGGSLRNEIVEFELKRALEWLQPLVPVATAAVAHGQMNLMSPRRDFSSPIHSANLSNTSNGSVGGSTSSIPRTRHFSAAYSSRQALTNLSSSYPMIGVKGSASTDGRRYAASLVLKELTLNATTLVFPHAIEISLVLWSALRDRRTATRYAAVEALRALIQLMQHRDLPQSLPVYQNLYEEAIKGLMMLWTTPTMIVKSVDPEIVDGSLLALQELLSHAPVFMRDKWKELYDLIFRAQTIEDTAVHQSLFDLLPAMASYNPAFFIEHHLDTSMMLLRNHLVAHEKDKVSALLNCGKLAEVVGKEVSRFAGPILEVAKREIEHNGRGTPSTTTLAAIECWKSFVRVLNGELAEATAQMLTYVFELDIHESIALALVDMADHTMTISLSDTIFNHLQDLVRQVLRQARLGDLTRSMSDLQLTTSPKRSGRSPGKLEKSLVILDHYLHPHAQETLTNLARLRLALRILRSLQFPPRLIDMSLYDSIMDLMDGYQVEVRIEAVQTLLAMLHRGPFDWTSQDMVTERLVEEITIRILMLAVSDPDASVRETALSSLLDDTFDQQLVQADHIHSLFIALNDDVFTIRQLALRRISRLADRNPAYILPPLRRLLVQLLVELEYQRTTGRKEETAALLGHLMRECPKLVSPYREPIFRALMLRVRDPIASVAGRSLMALAELVKVCHEGMALHVDDIIPALIEALKDQGSSLKREQALETLHHLGSYLGCAMEPYLTYPELLNTLLQTIRSEGGSSSARSKATRVLGCLGALDPYLQRTLGHELGSIGDDHGFPLEKRVDGGAVVRNMNPPSITTTTTTAAAVGVAAASMMTTTSSSAIPLLEILASMGPSQDDYYLLLVIHSLMKILNDPSLSVHHAAVIQAFMSMFNTLGLRCAQYLAYIMPAFLQMFRNVPSGLFEFHLRQLASLLCMIGQHARPYADEVIHLVMSLWKDPQLNRTTNANLGVTGASNDAAGGSVAMNVANASHEDGAGAGSGSSGDGDSDTISYYSTLVSVIEALSIAMDSEFRKYTPLVLPILVDMCDRDMSDRRILYGRILHAFVVMASRLEDFIYMILPPILHACERLSSPQELRLHALHVLAYLVSRIDMSDYASPIVHMFVRLFASVGPELRSFTMQSLTAVACYTSQDFQMFIPLLTRVRWNMHITGVDIYIYMSLCYVYTSCVWI